ncbi:MAG: 50S ribosomal protein L1 [Desulfuromonas sp. SDB]|nr:MAG: 50S ribosomal protein L1 [Desulfuromonas sp. SDB]
MKKSRRYQDLTKKLEKQQNYSLKEALEKITQLANAKFDETIEISMKLGIDPRKSDQMVRGSVILPHGTGKDVKVLVFVQDDDTAEQAKKAGADYVGGDELVEKISKEGWVDFDAVVSVPQMMSKVGKLGKILGPRGLMPNPKLGTVTPDVKGVVEEIKKGRVEFKADKTANLHVPVGKASFNSEKIYDNIIEFFREVIRIRPASVKGAYVRSVHLSSTMSPGIKIDVTDLQQAIQ